MQSVSTVLTGAIEAINRRAANRTGTAISAANSEDSRAIGALIEVANLKGSDEVDTALAGLLTSQLGLSVNFQTLNKATSERPFQRETISLSVKSPSVEATRSALRLLSAAEKPASNKQVTGWLATLRTLVKARTTSNFESEIMLRAHAERLQDYPADIVEHVLRTWPDHSEWWPSWFELRSCLRDAASPRQALIFAVAKKLHET